MTNLNNHKLSDTDLNAVSGGNPVVVAFIAGYAATKILDNLTSRPSVMDIAKNLVESHRPK